MSGLILDADPSIPAEQVVWHKALQFINVRKLELVNSKFINNKNMMVFSLYNIDRSDLYDDIVAPELIFDGITAINNTAGTGDDNSLYPSLFEVYSPLQPATASFTNSLFQNNRVCKLNSEEALFNCDSEWRDYD